MNLPLLKLPTFLQVEPVGQCNLRCQMCPIQFRKDGPPHGPPAFMDFGVFARMIDQFPDLQELLNERRAQRCVTSGLTEIHASIDGATAQTYERIRVRAHFDRVLGNLRLVLDAKQRLKSELPRLRMIVVVMRQNVHELPELVRLAHRFEIPAIFVQHLCHDFGEATLPAAYRPMREFVEEETLLHEDIGVVQIHFEAARFLARQFNIDLRLPSLTPRLHAPETPGPERCDWPWRGAYVSYQGLAMPCCMVATPDRIHFGNMAKDDAASVWNGPDYASFREQLSSPTPPEVCRSCSIYSGTF